MSPAKHLKGGLASWQFADSLPLPSGGLIPVDNCMKTNTL